MKILSIGLWDIVPPYSGYAKAVYSSLLALSRYCGVEATFLSYNVKRGEAVIRDFNEGGSYKAKASIFNLTNVVRDHMSGVDVVLCEGDLIWIPSLRVAKSLRIPCVWRLHALRSKALYYMIRTGAKNIIKFPFAVAHEFGGVAFTDLTIALSSSERESFPAFLKRRKIVEVEPTYIPTEFKVQAVEVLNDKNFVLFVGGSYEHNHEAIQYILALARIMPHTYFAIAGKASEFIGVDAKNIIKLPWVNERELTWLYRKSLAVILPFKWCVGVMMKLVEALYHGKTIIASPAVMGQLKGLRKVVIEAKTVRDFTRALETVVEDHSARKAYEVRTRTFFEQRLSPRGHAKVMAKVLDDLVVV